MYCMYETGRQIVILQIVIKKYIIAEKFESVIVWV